MDLTRVHAAIDSYVTDAAPADAARLSFFGQVFDLQQARAEELDATRGARYEPPAGVAAVAAYRDPATPVFATAPVTVDPAAFAQTCKEVTRVLVDKAGLSSSVTMVFTGFDWDAFVSRVDLARAGGEPARFVEEVVQGATALGVPTSMPLALLVSVLRLALRAHLQGPAERVVEAYQDAVKGQENDAAFSASLACPVCGAPAVLSWVGEAAGSDGRGRRQYCSLCGTQWDFERIRCAHCGTHNEGHLHYYNLQGDLAHRIQTCDECGGYQRVVFQEELVHAPMVVEVEDVVMANLDQLANDPRGQQELREVKLAVPAVDRAAGQV